MRMNVLTIRTMNDQTLYFSAHSAEKDENGLPEVDNVERIRAVLESEEPDAAFECADLRGEQKRVPAAEIASYDIENLEDATIHGH